MQPFQYLVFYSLIPMGSIPLRMLFDGEKAVREALTLSSLTLYYSKRI
ncbi:MAG: hypothetical protein BAJATHORv1_20562 [Candidatus Thorarchaeota archaeon]|nr:MAG: hypothetical protein BAJATHORv1_20562 [Candidatus Thorarchaeota archaeon]